MKPCFRPVLTLLAATLLAIPVPAQNGKGSASVKLRTVVIDPGHGGKDPGCVSRDKKTYEKDIVLDVGLRLRDKIQAAFPDVTVVMTRDDDTFVELENRAVIANQASANLFISIHVNAVEKGTSANGYSIHTLGQSAKKGNDLFSKNLDLVKRENSVIMLEEDYEARYQGFDPEDPQSYIIFNLMQNAHLAGSLTFADDVAKAMGTSPIKHSRGVNQDPFWVLWRTAMPSVLVEVGFITNPDDLATMRSQKGRDGIAENLFKAFSTFKSRYDGPSEETPVATTETTTSNSDKATTANSGETKESPAGPVYGTQILAIGKKMADNDPFFKGYKPTVVKSGKLYKYVVETSASLAEAKKKYSAVQKKFPDAYLVKIVDGATSPVR
jgi:N-acetylmuramoyl-L-alanine amidase